MVHLVCMPDFLIAYSSVIRITECPRLHLTSSLDWPADFQLPYIKPQLVSVSSH